MQECLRWVASLKGALFTCGGYRSKQRRLWIHLLVLGFDAFLVTRCGAHILVLNCRDANRSAAALQIQEQRCAGATPRANVCNVFPWNKTLDPKVAVSSASRHDARHTSTSTQRVLQGSLSRFSGGAAPETVSFPSRSPALAVPALAVKQGGGFLSLILFTHSNCRPALMMKTGVKERQLSFFFSSNKNVCSNVELYNAH